MSLAKYFEQITERQSAARPGADEDQSLILAERIRSLVEHYQTAQDSNELSRWERHVAGIRELDHITARLDDFDEHGPNAWVQLRELEEELRAFFQRTAVFGPLSRSVIKAAHETSRDINRHARQLRRELRNCRRSAPELATQLDGLADQLEADFGELENCKRVADKIESRWGRFLSAYTRLLVWHRHRPELQSLDRFYLNAIQEDLVAKEYSGAFRVQGASGAGKTIILIHRALRLARENPGRQVRVFTINRVLAEHLQNTAEAIVGVLPENMHVAALYDFLLECESLFGDGSEYRLVDELSRERVSRSWGDFFRHRGDRPRDNVFAAADVRQLVESLRQRGGIDASQYLRDEMTYVQSAFLSEDRERYLREPRKSRSIPLTVDQRRVVLKVLTRWEEWLGTGGLCDIDGFTSRASRRFFAAGDLARIRKERPTDFVLVDEVQDCSTIELSLLRLLPADPDGPNTFFLAGDRNQRVYPKHHDSSRSGFNFQGRGQILSHNFRNTKQILRAAMNLCDEYPPREENDQTDVFRPDLSEYEGRDPLVIECTPENHLHQVLEIVKAKPDCDVAVVSDNERFLTNFAAACKHAGFRCHKLLPNEELDRWKGRFDPSAVDLTLSRLEAVKGFEFDLVIACDLSEGVTPRPGLPADEHWRDAAVLYSALTRARDTLVMTYVGNPSVFLDVMAADVEWRDDSDSRSVTHVIRAV